MRCPHCHEEHPNGAKFCNKTGASILSGINDSLNDFPLAGLNSKSNLNSHRFVSQNNQIISLISGFIGIVFLFVAYLVYIGEFDLNFTEIFPRKEQSLSDTPTSASILSSTNQNEQFSHNAEENLAPTVFFEKIQESVKTSETANPETTKIVESITPTNESQASNLTPSPSQTNSNESTQKATEQLLRSEWIVFTVGEDEKREIYLLQPWTGEKRQLTSNIFNDEAPTHRIISQKVVYSSYRSDGWELYLLDFKSMQETQLTKFSGQARHPQWNPINEDNLIVFEGRTNTDSGLVSNVWLLDLDTSDIKQLTFGNSDSRPQWSPDGKQVVFGRALQDNSGDGRITSADFLSIFTLDIATGEIFQVTKNNIIDNFQYSWSPDGEWILYCSVRSDVNGDGFMNLDDSRNLWKIRPDGEDDQEIKVDNLSTFSPSWSPDGKYIVFTAHKRSGEEVWIYDLSSKSLQRILSSGPYYHTKWSIP